MRSKRETSAGRYLPITALPGAEAGRIRKITSILRKEHKCMRENGILVFAFETKMKRKKIRCIYVV